MATRDDNSDFDVIDLLLDEGVVAYQRALARIAGDASTGLLLSQFWYWSNRLPPERDGWFYKRQSEIYEETVLTRREQETARRNLRNLLVLEECKRGVPAVLWFRINRRVVKELLQANAATRKGGKRHPRMAESADQGCPDRPDQPVRKRLVKTKTTSKTTSKITATGPDSMEKPGALDAAVDLALVEELVSHQVNRTDAIRLAHTRPNECRRQLDFLPYLAPRTNPGGWLREAIENGHGAPAGYEDARRRDRDQERRAKQAALESARQRHEVAYKDAFIAYLTQCEGALRETRPELFSEFLEYEAQERARLERAPLTPKMLGLILEDFDDPVHHLARVERFFSKQAGCATLDFWAWDGTLNPHPFYIKEEHHT